MRAFLLLAALPLVLNVPPSSPVESNKRDDARLSREMQRRTRHFVVCLCVCVRVRTGQSALPLMVESSRQNPLPPYPLLNLPLPELAGSQQHRGPGDYLTSHTSRTKTPTIFAAAGTITSFQTMRQPSLWPRLRV